MCRITQISYKDNNQLQGLPYPPLGCVKLSLESNPVPYPEDLYLSISAFFC